MTSRIVSIALMTCLLLTGCAFREKGGSAGGVIGLREDGSPFVAFNVWIHCGSRNDPPGKEGLAALTASYLASGPAEQMTYEEIIDSLYPMAADYQASVDKEMTNFTGYIHRDNLEDYYEVFKAAILAPAFNAADFERVKTRTLGYLKKTRRFSNDEELSKELLFREIYRGTPYEHPEEGYVRSVESLSLEDVKDFYSDFYTRNNITAAVGGGFPPGFKRKVRSDFDALPEGKRTAVARPDPSPIHGIHVLVVEKNTDSSPVSLGFPIELLRSDKEFPAMMLFNSALGEHRSFHGRLFQIIRQARGLNYGDYTYIEAFPQGYATQVPPVNVGRLSQIFEVWIRPVAATGQGTLHNRTLFSIRTVLRELKRIADNGLSPEEFSSTRNFLENYTANYGNTLSRRLAYRVDDAFYGMTGAGFLASIRSDLEVVTLEEVQQAIHRYIQLQNFWIVVITEDAEAFKEKLVSGVSTPIEYPGPQPEAVLEEDKIIAEFPIPIKEKNVQIIDINDVFEE